MYFCTTTTAMRVLLLLLMWIVSESGSITSSSSSSKRPRLDQLPAANLDADDPLDDDVSSEVIFCFVKYYQNCQASVL